MCSLRPKEIEQKYGVDLASLLLRSGADNDHRLEDMPNWTAMDVVALDAQIGMATPYFMHARVAELIILR